MEALMDYAWPGNVRELENSIERALLICRTPELEPDDFPFQTLRAAQLGGRRLEDIERAHIERVLTETNWNLSHAARVLAIDRTTLYNKIRRYELDDPRRIR
jgi:transcriptional regulator of acetoin/glycerol metabolism